MKSLKLTDAELLSMKQFYDRELDQTLSKLDHIKKVLKKLGANVPDVNVSIKGKGVTGVSKRGRKSKWGAYIKDVLSKGQVPMTYEGLVESAMKDFKLPETKKASTRQAIISSTYRLRNMHDDLRTFAMKGSRIKFVALDDWFSPNGKILSEFSSRITNIPKPVFQEGKRPGRPRKVVDANAPVKAKTTRKPKAKKATTAKSAAPKKAVAVRKKAATPKKASAAKKVASPKKATTAKKRTVAKKPVAAKKPAAKKPAVKKVVAKKAASPKKAAAPKKAAPKKVVAKKVVAKKVVAKKAKPAKKKVTKKVTAKKSAAVKPSSDAAAPSAGTAS